MIMALGAILLAPSILSGQTCLPDGITFVRQSQIDSFPFNYPGCTIIEGDADVRTFVFWLNGMRILIRICSFFCFQRPH